jgi:2-oxoacid dehydrogenases acyltransferase (catalytic domain)
MKIDRLGREMDIGDKSSDLKRDERSHTQMGALLYTPFKANAVWAYGTRPADQVPAVIDECNYPWLVAPTLRSRMKEFLIQMNKLTVTEMTGGTFTVSNLGLTRVGLFTPIINSPQIAILGIGRTVEKAVRSQNGALELHPHIGLSLTFDHRAVDGAPAADFLSELCRTVEGEE